MFFKEFLIFIKHIFESRNILFILALQDFKDQYLGSYIGTFWAILRPLLFILAIWFVFTIGFKKIEMESGVPFILYLLCGYIPWIFFAESVNGGMRSVINNKFLVKKVAFRVAILPLIKIISSLIFHIFFLGILILILLVYGYTPTIYWLQLPFFIACTIVLALGLGWLTSSLRVFVKDIDQVISVFLQLGFWLTPIFWKFDIVPEQYYVYIYMNPMVFIVEGYRNSLISHAWFWEAQTQTFYFLTITLMTFIGGALVFKKLRPHFGDLL